MVVKSPLKFKENVWGFERRDGTLKRRLELYQQKKGVGSCYTLGHTLPRDIALGRIFAGVYRGVSQAFHVNVLTLGRLSLPEKRILKES